jgi:hypothetical protein
LTRSRHHPAEEAAGRRPDASRGELAGPAASGGKGQGPSRGPLVSERTLPAIVLVPIVGAAAAVLLLTVGPVSASFASIDPGMPLIQPTPYAIGVESGSAARLRVSILREGTCEVRFGKIVKPLEAQFHEGFEIVVKTRSSTRSGTYPLTVSCPAIDDQVSYTIVVSRSKRRRPSQGPGKGARRRAGVVVRAVGPPTPDQVEAEQTARQRWTESGSTVLEGFRSGQCTDWAAQRRPDLVERVTEAQTVARLRREEAPPSLADAQEWPESAKAVGYQLSDYPLPGALVVWREGAKVPSPAAGTLATSNRCPQMA